MTTATLPPTETVAPVQQAERIQIVDILLVNMAIFIYPFQTLVFPADPAMPWYDWFATWLIHFLGKVLEVAADAPLRF